VGFSFFAAAGDLILSGKVRALAVTGPSRLSVLPDVPTFKEAGVPEFQYDSWFGILAPAGVPKEIVVKASQDITQVLGMPDVKARFEPQGAVLITASPERFEQTIRTDSERYSTLFKGAN
jgi:tripartite-type tricarboxylate transporter receptor subunit TctC